MYTILFDEAEARGENKLGELMSRMREDGLIDEAFRAAAEEPYRYKMYEKYGMLDLQNQESEYPLSKTMVRDNS